MRKPRTLAEKTEARSRARARFFAAARALTSWDHAWDFAYGGPRAIDDGGNLYTNLVYFMRGGIVPDGVDDEQVALYRELVQRFGNLTPRGFR